MDLAMALAVLFFCLLLLSSAAIAFLLLRHALSALRRCRRNTDGDIEEDAGRRQLPPLSPPQQELPFLPAVDTTTTKLLLLSDKKEEGEPPRKLTWREVEALTGGFDEAAVVGRGGSSTVYLAARSPAAPVAVKVHRWCGGERWLRAFRQELDLLRRLRHPHIVSLLAYSDDHEEGGALVLEYLSGGTLADRLHGGAAPPLPWRHRMRIVHDVAGALEHLHDGLGGAPPVVHGDVSASNVLLDGRGLGARLCDLGSACEGFSAAVAPTRAAVGSPGYVDPFFLRTGIVSKKSDVYSFGVLLLEAITGSPAAGMPGPDGAGGGNLTARLLPRVRTEGVEGLVDRRLGDDYDAAEAGDVARIGIECLAAQPGLRPAMAQVRAAIAEKAARSISIAAAAAGDHSELHGSNST
ncbi:salt tolerance receptor-like cytoplasmic kinase 1 [Oryza brachyantha]|uniref:salt tolerance receptor-like cytoplasmic kinase 1 n=1 Tax=Oryza brachyantha TaxID=4533 RepID=UPI001ADCE6A8|nr:salt tolerance receptor-like cytoplasmic kinase 1 [Oryza brachyantha]